MCGRQSISSRGLLVERQGARRRVAFAGPVVEYARAEAQALARRAAVVDARDFADVCRAVRVAPHGAAPRAPVLVHGLAVLLVALDGRRDLGRDGRVALDGARAHQVAEQAAPALVHALRVVARLAHAARLSPERLAFAQIGLAFQAHGVDADQRSFQEFGHLEVLLPGACEAAEHQERQARRVAKHSSALRLGLFVLAQVAESAAFRPVVSILTIRDGGRYALKPVEREMSVAW
mmetsp:Transcript_10904/g.32545  ORF Transcript_10904/g.32545 Transcript_10904/m.32545 type:complete len:235 (-) Transcript_10904:28-732(-)